MSKISFKIGDSINDILLELVKDKITIPEARRQILAVPEIAIVDREAWIDDDVAIGLECGSVECPKSKWVKEVKGDS